METRFLVLRRLPRRSVLLLYSLCAMVAACALVTLYLESGDAPPQPTVHHPLKNDTLHADDPSGISTTQQPTPKFVPPGTSWISSKGGDVESAKNTPAASSNDINVTHSRNTQTSKPAHRPQPRKTFRDNTRYIYLTTNSTPTTTAASVASRVTKRTAVARDTCDSGDEEDAKLILLWTSFFGHWGYMPRERFEQCSECRNCRVTRDRTRLAEADAVVFHARDMSLADLPPFRLPRQRWVFYCLESPPYSDFPGLQHMRHMFNWTMTYRADSDILSQYGSVKRVRPPRPLDMPALRASFLAKSRSVVWLSSHCPTYGGRDAFVDELRAHIDVDTYGKCGGGGSGRVCPADSADFCHGEFASKYKFLLAFENTVCRDYITEKFFRTLQFDIVPVVFGGADYERFAPPGSFVDALRFKSPRHLAFFLRGVGEDFDKYATYFRWRADYRVRLMNEKECGMCRLLHHDGGRKSYADLRKWWVDGSRCRTWESKL